MNDITAEENLIACCLLDAGDSLARAMAFGARTSWFECPKCAGIFSILTYMLTEGKAVGDIGVVVQELTVAGEFQRIGGMPYIVELSGRLPTTLGFADYLNRVRNCFILRSVNQEAKKLAAACATPGTMSLEEIMDGPLARLLALSSRSDSGEEQTWPDTITEALASAEGIITGHRNTGEAMLSWPWPTMDELFEPMRAGQLITVGARPSIGKSSLCRQIIGHAAKAGKRCYLGTLEVAPVQVALGLGAALSGVGVRDLVRAHARDQADFRAALESIRNFKISISTKDKTIARIAAKLRGLKASSHGLDLAVIDHGGLVREIYEARSPGEKQNAISQLTKTLKALATDLGIVVILVWQLNRSSASDGNREPRLFDLRDSGSLEEDSDKVLLIHRPSEDPVTKSGQSELDDKDKQPSFFQNVIQAKGRDDGTSIMSFYFTRRTASFKPVQIDEPPETF